MSGILLIRSFVLRVEMDASSSSMFVWFIWCSWALTKQNEKLAKQFIRTAHKQSTFLRFLGKCGNINSVCIISHIIVPALVTFQISRRQTSYHWPSKNHVVLVLTLAFFRHFLVVFFFCNYSHSNHPLIQRCVRCPWIAWVSKACLFCVFNHVNDLSICGVLLKMWLYSCLALVCMTQASFWEILKQIKWCVKQLFWRSRWLSVCREIKKRLNLTRIRLLDKGCT